MIKFQYINLEDGALWRTNYNQLFAVLYENKKTTIIPNLLLYMIKFLYIILQDGTLWRTNYNQMFAVTYALFTPFICFCFILPVFNLPRLPSFIVSRQCINFYLPAVNLTFRLRQIYLYFGGVVVYKCLT